MFTVSTKSQTIFFRAYTDYIDETGRNRNNNAKLSVAAEHFCEIMRSNAELKPVYYRALSDRSINVEDEPRFEKHPMAIFAAMWPLIGNSLKIDKVDEIIRTRNQELFKEWEQSKEGVAFREAGSQLPKREMPTMDDWVKFFGST